MTEAADSSNAIIRPPIAWALAFVAGLALDWLYPLRFVPASIPAALVGGAVFAAGFALAIWAIITIRKAGSRVELALLGRERRRPYLATVLTARSDDDGQALIR